jgi:soluble lytic murein transglycosylase-like protein
MIGLCGAVLLLNGCASGALAGRVGRRHYDRGRIKALVAREAADLGVSVPLALAVAHAESNFDAQAESHAGARGVMQIMPATARGEYGIDPDLLWDPRINVRLGLHFLARLLRRYRGRVDLALSYYNGGSAVGRLPNARVIPATYKYVARVRRLEKQYRRQLARQVI